MKKKKKSKYKEVKRYREKFTSNITINLGYYNTPKEAHLVYLKMKRITSGPASIIPMRNFLRRLKHERN